MAAQSGDLSSYIRTLSILTDAQVDRALKLAQTKTISLPDAIASLDLVDDVILGQIVADFYGLPFIDLTQVSISPDALQVLPQSVARAQQAIVFSLDEQAVHVATTQSAPSTLESVIAVKTGKTVHRYYTTSRQIRAALSLYEESVQETFSEMMDRQIKNARGKSESDPPIIEMVDTLILHAYHSRASDIHIEPQEDTAHVRFRIDGVLHDIVDIPLPIHQRIATRLKIMAHLRTDEQQAAQDGKISFTTKEERLDIRVSLVPITGGENIVMRLLSETSRQFSLSGLGFADSDMKLVQEAYKKPHGMILITGPTGSGKTTTMYAILKLINNPTINIMTIEDPVEYAITGIQQIQVNPKTDVTFASGLRAIVRQDPDVILVGEIRDEETADISVNAAMTGHLLLSTLHTNDAATTLPRLIDMGVEPYLIASTVNCIIAQRLVRKICQACRVSVKPTEAEEKALQSLGKGALPTQLYRGKGCDVCRQTGYVGRIAVFEVMVISEKIRDAIVAKQDAGSIRDIAIAAGMHTLMDDGYAKVRQGLTTIEEVLRVTKES